MKANRNVWLMRQQAGHTQKYVAAYLDIIQQTYQKIESGKIALKPEYAARLGRLYGQPPEFFYGPVADASPPEHPIILESLQQIIETQKHHIEALQQLVEELMENKARRSK